MADSQDDGCPCTNCDNVECRGPYRVEKRGLVYFTLTDLIRNEWVDRTDECCCIKGKFDTEQEAKVYASQLNSQLRRDFEENA